MLKARFNNGCIVFGLSDENIKRLKRGMPIKLNLSELGMEPQDIFIVHGKTEKDIEKALKGGMLPH